ncbi:hypothetical protein [Nocardioides sp. GCM10030258]|uniref:hypothetical protein n=1 Tax=unclassified Nocardioides TaxID=2615069 RepID=UPI00360A014D
MRDKLLKPRGIPLVDRSRVVIGEVEHCNPERPRSGLQVRTPIGYAAYIAIQPTLSTEPCERG